MQAWAEGPDVESRISLAPIAVQLTLAGPGALGAYIVLAQLRRGGLPFKMNGSPPRVCLSTGQYMRPAHPAQPPHSRQLQLYWEPLRDCADITLHIE